MTKVIINGYRGRMGQALISCADAMSDLEVVGQVDQGDDLGAVIDECDAVIDFSFHEATLPTAKICAERGKPVVIGTTGHADEIREQIVTQSKSIPMVWASNFSTGVNTLFWLTRKAAEVLNEGFDLEVIEMHHRLKRDAPSGTAATLLEILRDVRQQGKEVVQHGREGIVGERTDEEIGMHSMRGGDVVGDHTVMFSANGERFELTHKASSRNTFANGALRAAKWATGRDAGIYDMQDVLGLK